MKKQILLITAVFCLAVLSCSKEHSFDNTNGKETIYGHVMQQKNVPATNEEKAGYYHNYYLNKYYEDLQARAAAKHGIENLSRNDFKTAFRTSCSNGITGDNASTIKNKCNTACDNALAANNVEAIITGNIAQINNCTTVTTGLKAFLVDFIEDGQGISSIEEMEDFTGTAWNYVNDHFQSTEKSIAQSTIWVYRYSFIYWSEHADEWQALIDPNGNGPDPTQKLGKYGSADVSGFTSGSITGAILGGSVTLGTMTAPGWLVGGCVGAVANSLGAIAGDLWTWFIEG